MSLPDEPKARFALRRLTWPKVAILTALAAASLGGCTGVLPRPVGGWVVESGIVEQRLVVDEHDLSASRHLSGDDGLLRCHQFRQ